MKPICVQLNHPGVEKPFVLNDGYVEYKNKIIRVWNKDRFKGKNGKARTPHYRKYICSHGEYISNSKILKDNLLFWGEWEGNSYFEPLHNKKDPNGIHFPFHSNNNRRFQGFQNTDPYVFGEFFKYCICSQTGIMKNLSDNSLILFGTTTDKGFLLDTVFVVKTNETAENIFKNKGCNYSKAYFEETLNKLEEYTKNPLHKNRLYHGLSWYDNREYFSFVPCSLKSNPIHKKALINLPYLHKQKVGHPYRNFEKISVKKIWNDIVNILLKEQFVLGIKFEEPKAVELL